MREGKRKEERERTKERRMKDEDWTREIRKAAPA